MHEQPTSKIDVFLARCNRQKKLKINDQDIDWLYIPNKTSLELESKMFL